MVIRAFAKALSLVCLLGLAAACSNDSSSQDMGGVALNVKSASAATFNFADQSFDSTVSPNIFTPTDYGGASVGVSGLSSLKLYISKIQLCKSMTINGSGYSNSSGCVDVYTNANATDDYSNFGVANAATAGTGKYFDILSPTDRAILTASTSIPVGTYNFGLISWYRPIKITGAVALNNGSTLYTKTCAYSSGVCTTTNMAAGPAEESIYDSNNGGTWFKFLSPFTVTKGSTTAVDLAFNLEKKLIAGDSLSNGFINQATGCSAVTSGYCGMYIPGIRLSPVPRQATESTKIESYIMAGPSNQWNIRVDLYYNSADSAQAVLAADVFPVPTSNTASSIAAGVYLYTVTTSGGVTTFNDSNGVPQMSFTRGASGTASFLCPTGATLASCTAGSTVSLTWSSRTSLTLQN